MLRAVLVVLAAVMGAACTSPLESLTGPSPDELAGRAFAGLDSAPATHLAGSFSNAGRHFTIDCTVNRNGDAQGSVELDGRSYRLIVSGGRTYVQGQGFWAAYGDPTVARLYGDSWALLDANGVNSVGGPASPCSVGRSLRNRRFQLKNDGQASVAGRSAVQLSDSSGRLYLTTGQQPRLLRILSARGYRAPDGTSDLRLDFGYPPRATVTAPSAFVDPADPRTFPAHYVAEAVRIGRCDASACALSATVRNLAGAPSGRSTATLRLRAADNSDLGSCTVDLPPIAYQQTQDVSCTVGGGPWSSFFGGSSDRRYFARATIQNPPYDS
ncbi:MAG: hypothetical protein M3Z97_09280 [Candidatus Dormibacteraeota bacterium]|nr:hypothetical protein [Candidatus Dormibacteraeota bacterium]